MSILRKQPLIEDLDRVSLPPVERRLTSLDVPLYIVRDSTQELVKIDVVFDLGNPHELKPLVSAATAHQLKEGTDRYSSDEIADLIDFYGASLQIQVQPDHITLSLVGMKKHLRPLIPVLGEVFLKPTFPERELEIFIKRQLERLEIDLAKGDVVAYRELTEYIFGPDHPYGYNSSKEYLRSLVRADLISHHSQFQAKNCLVFISGAADEEVLGLLTHYLDQLPTARAVLDFDKRKRTFGTPTRKHIRVPGTRQASIRLGKQMPGRFSDENEILFVLNTIFGGCFGSRLNLSVRETRGLTYNIFSNYEALSYGGFLSIGCETSTDHVEPVIQCVRLEAERLAAEKISDREMRMLRNYLIGYLMTMLDGPFHISDLVKSLVTEGKGLEQFDELVDVIMTVDSSRIQTCARDFLVDDSMWEIVVS
jgi:zinc protease